jgi:predicted Ser/Thr protein kinase
VLHALEAIVRDRTVYEWLSLEPEGAYRRPETFIADVAGFWHDRLEREVRLATRLVDDVEHGKLFDRYIMHIHHWLRGEKLVDPASGVSTSPDERLMAHMEEVLGQSKEDPRQVRSAVISQVAAFRIDHPDAAMAWERIFPRQLERLEEYYYQSQQRAVARICRNIVALESPEGPAMEPADEAEARATLARLQTEAGHSQGSALEAVSVLLRHRWADVPAK